MKPTVFAGLVADLSADYRLYRQVRALKTRGFGVTVAGFFDPRRPPDLSGWDGIKILPLKVSRSRLPGLLFFMIFMLKLFRAALRERPSIYLACDLPPLISFSLAKIFTGGRLIYDSREVYTELPDVYAHPMKKWAWKILERFALRRADACIAVGEGDRETLVSLYPGLSPVVVRNLPLFKPPAPSRYLREKLKIDGSVPILLHQGSLLVSGGVVELVEALPMIERAHLVILGAGPESERVRRAIEKSAARKRITLLPPVPFPGLHAVTCSADLGLYVGKGEGLSNKNVLPNKLFEYAMAGLPMVLSDLPEIRKVNREFEVAELITEIRPESIAGAVHRLLSDPGRLSRYKVNGLAMARKLCWEKEEPKFSALFES